MKHSLVLDNLNCAHCASRIESKIADTDGFEQVSFNFATKKLVFVSEKESPIDEIQAICDSIEDGVEVRLFEEKAPAHEHHHEHGEHCGGECRCHEEHEHGHEHAHHEKKEKKGFLNRETSELIAAIVFAASAAALHIIFHDSEFVKGLVLGLSLASTIIAGYRFFAKGVKNLFKLQIDENFLMTVAVVAAFALGEYVEAAMVATLFSLGEFIEDIAVNRSRRDIEKLSQIRPDNATVIRSGKELLVGAAEVEVGEEILVKPHERVPLDGVILSGESMLDASALTGESIPFASEKGAQVLSGTVNGDGVLRIQTTKPFGESTASKILNMVEDAAARKGKRERFITRFAAVYTPIMIGLSVLIAFLPPLLGFGSFQQWIYNALAVLVASCPCAIVISVPLAYYSGIGAASRQGCLIKGGKYLEALAATDAAAFDKTGTLTSGKLEVTDVIAFDNYSEDDIIRIAAACEKYSSHPIAEAIRSRAGENVPELEDCTETAGSGVSAVYNGKKLICGSRKSAASPIPESAESADVFLSLDGRLIGALRLGDSIREEAAEVLGELNKMKIRTIMLTGDSEQKAEQVGKALKISEYRAELLPEDKLSAVTELKEKSRAVCFVGDGINDAPVLAASDCGIAMGLGSEAAIEAADAVLSSGSLRLLPKAIATAKRTVRTIRANIIFALAVKAAVIVLACLGLAAIWMSVVADTGVCVLCVLFTARLLK